MKISNKQIIDCLASISLLSKEKMPVLLAYKIDLIRQNIEPYFLAANNMISEAKLERAKKDENGKVLLQKNAKGEEVPGAFLFSQEDLPIVNQEISEVLDDKIEIPNLIQIKMSEFPPNLMISPDAIAGLRPLLVNQ